MESEECVPRIRLESAEADIEKLRSLLVECRKWLDAGGRTGRNLGYVEFRQRLGAALGEDRE